MLDVENSSPDLDATDEADGDPSYGGRIFEWHDTEVSHDVYMSLTSEYRGQKFGTCHSYVMSLVVFKLLDMW